MVSAVTAGLLATSLPALASSGTRAGAVSVAAVPSSHYEQPGPHGVTKAQGGPNCTLYYPADLGGSGIRHPILVWGNGTGATPESYDGQLRHLATWGVVVAAANTTQAGSGREMLACGKFVVAENQRAGSVFHGKIDQTKFGAAGHSQGGGGAIAAGADPIVTTTIPVQPGPQGTVSSLRGPSLFIAGQNDWIVPSSYVRSRYSQATQIPAVFAELRGSDHFFPGETRIRLIGVLTAWSRFHLMGDEQARGIFFGPPETCGICNDRTAWSAVARNRKALAIPA